MLARCARCQGTFTTEHFGLQTCPHCGAELLLADPNAPAGAPAAQPPAPPPVTPAPATPGAGPSAGAAAGAPGEVPPAAPPPVAAGAPPELPPPPAPPPGGYGPPPSGWAPPPAGGGWGPPPGGYGPELAAPFAERAQRGFFSSFFSTWRRAALEPEPFFSRVRIDQTGSAVLFGIIASLVGTLVQLLLSLGSWEASVTWMNELLSRVPDQDPTAERMRALLQEAGPGLMVVIAATTLVWVIVRLFVVAALVHVCLVAFRAAPRGFGATLTVVGYASGVYLLDAIPGCGWLVAPIWFTIALVIGLGAAQRCGAGKAIAAVALPGLVACVCCCGIGSLGGIFRALQEAARPGSGGPVDL